MGASHSRAAPKKQSIKQVSQQSYNFSGHFHNSQTLNLHLVSRIPLIEKGIKLVIDIKDKEIKCPLAV